MRIREHALWEPADPETEAIRNAYCQHGVLVFRRQAMSEPDLLAFGNMVGEPSLYAEPHWLSTVPEVILLSNMRSQTGKMLGGLSNKALTWHTDQSYYAEPVTGCFLYGVELPLEGGATRWASLYDAYETLPDELHKVVDGAVGTFSYAARSASAGKADDNHDWKRRLRETPDVKHPLVNVNPATGRKALYVDPGTVTGIDGMPEDEALDLLDRLLAQGKDPRTSTSTNGDPGTLSCGTTLWCCTPATHSQMKPARETHAGKADPKNHIIPPAVN